MNPWLRELVHTLAAIAVEEEYAREFNGPREDVASDGKPQTAITDSGSVAGRATAEAPDERRGQS